MGDAHGHCLPDPVDFVQDLVDLPRVDVVAGRDDHVLLAVHDVEVALLVHVGDVAGVEPVVANGAGGLVRQVPVAPHDLGPPDYQLAHLARTQGHRAHLLVNDAGVGVWKGEADGADLAFSAQGVEVGDGGGFGQPVPLDDLGAGAFLELVDGLHRDGGRARDAVADGGQVVLVDVLLLQQGQEHGRGRREDRGFDLVDDLEHVLRDETGEGSQRGAHGHAQIEAHGQAVDMEVGQQPQEGLLVPADLVQHGQALLQVGPQVGVGDHDPLGHPGGPAGVLQQGQVAGGVDAVALERRPPLQQLFPAQHVLVVIGHRGHGSLFSGLEPVQQVQGCAQRVGNAGHEDPAQLELGQQGLELGPDHVQGDQDPGP